MILMMQEDPLLVEARRRFRQISANLDRRLDELQAKGVLTQTDKLKLRSDALQSGHAVLQALDKTDYPLEMQRELVNRLIGQFDTAANDILSKAESRLFSKDRVETRLQEIDQHILTEFGTSAYQWADTHRKVFEEAHEDFKRQLRKHPQDYSGIESLFKHYEEHIRSLFLKNLPQIETPQENRYEEKVLKVDMEDINQKSSNYGKERQEVEQKERSLWKKVKSIFSRQGD